MITTLAAPAFAAAHHWQAGPPFPFFLGPVLFLVVLVALALVFGVLRRGNWRAVADARAVLADRFARGDISAEEYRARLSELSRK